MKPLPSPGQGPAASLRIPWSSTMSMKQRSAKNGIISRARLSRKSERASPQRPSVFKSAGEPNMLVTPKSAIVRATNSGFTFAGRVADYLTAAGELTAEINFVRDELAQIGEALLISPKTVESYRRRVKAKLAIDSTGELLQYAVQWVQNEKSSL